MQCGKKLVFIGMDILITNNGKVRIGMWEYIKEVIEMFDEDVSTKLKSAVYGKLNMIQETEPLNEYE